MARTPVDPNAIRTSGVIRVICLVLAASLAPRARAQESGPPGFGPPGFDGPGFEGPSFEGPSFEGPGFEGPGFEGPGFEGPGFGPGGPGGPNAPEREILKEFDKDGNGRLEGAERDAARAELKKSEGNRGGRGGMRGGRRPRADATPKEPGPRVSPADVATFPDAPLFATDVVRTFFLDFDVANWEEELELFHNTDADVPARMTVDGQVFEGVGVHFRGASSYMMVPRGTKRSLNVAVDHTDPAARLHGQNTLNFLNANGDPSFLSSILYSHLARPHLPAPRANLVEVVVNGESWGVFVNVEQFNKAFLRDRWPEFEGDGARWKVVGSPRGTGGLDDRGDDLAEYRERYEIKTKDRKEDWRALVALCKTLSGTPIERLEEALRPMLDLDGVLWFLALDVATANSDGYWTRASDYSLYRDPKGVFHLVPHDMNEAFKATRGGPGGPGGRGGPPGMDGPGGFDGPRGEPPAPPVGRPGRGMRPRPAGPDGTDAAPQPRGAPGAVAGQDARPQAVEGPRRPQARGGSMTELDPLVALDDATKPLRSRLLQVPALRARYLEHLRTLGAEMSWERMGPVVAALRATIAERIARDTRKAASTEAFERATSQEADGALRQFLERRSKFLLGYAAPVSAPTATGDGKQAPARDPVKDPVRDPVKD